MTLRHNESIREVFSVLCQPWTKMSPHESTSRPHPESIRLVAVAGIVLVLCTIAFVFPAAGQGPAHSTNSEADQFVRQGIAARQHGDNRSAIEDFKKALAIQPEMAAAHKELGEVLAAAGDLDAAIQEDTRALELVSDKTPVRTNLGLAYYKKGDLLHAREQYEAVHAIAPRDVNAAVMLGYIYVKLGKEAEAVSLLTPMEAGHESNMDLEYVLAFSLIQTGNDKDGVPRIEKVAKATHRADAYVIAGASLLHRGKMSAARVDLDAAMKLDSSIPGLPSMAGQACYALGDMKSATLDFQTALRQNPRDFDANLDLGAIRLKERDFEDAQALLELAVELQPGSPIGRLELAKLHAAMGNYSKAAAILEELVKTEPNWMQAHWDLATAYFELDRPEDGKRERGIAQKLRAHLQNAADPSQTH